MKYLRKFENEGDVFMTVKPNVVLVKNTNKVIYNAVVPDGIYIQHIDGNLYTTDEWTAGGFTNDLANGVAVASSGVQFVVAKTDASSNATWSSSTANAVEIAGIMLTADETLAKTDYAGEINTNKIVAADSGATAAMACDSYIFPNGKKGYLPAMGELNIINMFMTAFNEAVTLIEGATLYNAHYWSSTQYNTSKAWRFNPSTGVFIGASKAGYGESRNYVRACTTL